MGTMGWINHSALVMNTVGASKQATKRSRVHSPVQTASNATNVGQNLINEPVRVPAPRWTRAWISSWRQNRRRRPTQLAPMFCSTQSFQSSPIGRMAAGKSQQVGMAFRSVP